MTYPYGTKGAPVVGGGAPGLPRRASAPARGESTFAIPGTYTWVCPGGVTSVSVVCVGGGGGPSNGKGAALAFRNNIPVVSGDSYTIIVGRGGFVQTNGGVLNGTDSSAFSCVAGGAGTQGVGVPSGIFNGGGNGGLNIGGGAGAGGGAGGYSGNGGNAGATSQNGFSGSGGGGGGGGGDGGGGGGVGLFGQGVNGLFGSSGGGGGGGGSGGKNGGNSDVAAGRAESIEPLFGGGAASRGASPVQGSGGGGAVRIVFPGATRLFPSTDVGTP